MSATEKSVKEARELYELKEKAAKFYAENGVPKKMEEILNTMFYDNPKDVYGYLANYFQSFSATPTITKCVSRTVSSSQSPLLLEIAKPEEREEEDKEREDNVTAAIKYINNEINEKLQGLDPTKQQEADQIVSTLIAELKAAEDERLAKEAEEREKTDGETDEPEKKTGSALSKPKSGGKGKGSKGGGAPVVVVPDEPRESILCGCCSASSVSQALCTAGANVNNTELYEYIAGLKFGASQREYRLPLPMVTIFQSGRSTPGKSACVKEYMIVPKPGKSMKEAIPQIMAIYNDVVKSILNKNGVAAKNVSDLGALMMPFDRPEQGLDMIKEACERVGVTLGEDFYIALNLAGHEIFDYDKVGTSNKDKVPQSFPLAGRAAEKGKYEVITGQQKVADDLVEFWVDLIGRYPAIIAIIDPMRKQEDRQWMSLCERISEKCYIMGDQVWHRPGLLKNEELPERFKSSGVVFRMEQMNTVSDIIECSQKMEEASNVTVISTNIGETSDTFMADMAVGMNAMFVKVGAPCRGERVSKLNRLMVIEQHLEETGRLSAHTDFTFPVITIPPEPEPEEGETEVQDTPKDAKKK